MICYSNAIFQCIASCLHLTDFLKTPPDDKHQQFRLYYAFASVISSMVSGQESVVDPTQFIRLYRDLNKDYDPEEGMYCDNG
jgi:ubiquitin C-terminal hydrolase